MTFMFCMSSLAEVKLFEMGLHFSVGADQHSCEMCDSINARLPRILHLRHILVEPASASIIEDRRYDDVCTICAVAKYFKSNVEH